MVALSSTIRRCGLKPRILSRNCRSNPLMTLMTMISTATPKVTPSTEIKVMTETNVLLGRRYRNASSSSKGRPDMRTEARTRATACQRSSDQVLPRVARNNSRCPTDPNDDNDDDNGGNNDLDR